MRWISKNFIYIKKYGFMESVYRFFAVITKEEIWYTKIYKKRKIYYDKLTKDELKKELQEMFESSVGFACDLDHPRKFTEKIQWMKIYDSTPIKTCLADKYRVREWVGKKIGYEHLVPLISVWDSFDEIDFSKLPNAFCLKMNHGSAMNYVVRDKNKADIKKIEKKFRAWIDRPAEAITLEMQYKDIPKKILAEQYIEEMDGRLYDYKIHCFDGKPQFIQCIGDRDIDKHTGYQQHYDINWNKLDWTFGDYPDFPYDLDKPNKLEEMIDIAKILSADFNYVRVDLYEIGNKVYFGEMTFTPASGRYPYNRKWNESLDRKYGDMIKLKIN